MNVATLPLWAALPMLAVVAFVQNMAFTWVSRSRNGGDVGYHRRAAWCSNGVWFVTQILLFNVLWSSLTHGALWKVAVVGAVYVLATTEGSCLMMARLLKTEKGKRAVGARADAKPAAADPVVTSVRSAVDAYHCGHLNQDMAMAEIERILDMPDPVRKSA